MKNTLLMKVLAPSLFAALLIGGCQKGIESASEEGLRGGTRSLSSHECELPCASNWAATAETIELSNGFSAEVSHDQTKWYLRIKNTSPFGQIRLSVPGVSADLPANQQGDNIGFDPAVTSYPALNMDPLFYELPIDWAGCNTVTFSFRSGNYSTGPVSYQLRKLCTETTLTPASSTICLDATQTLTATVSANEAFQGGTLQIQEDIAGSWTAVATVNVTNSVKSITYDVTSSSEVTRTFKAVYSGTGQYNTSMSSNATVTFEECGCEYEGNAFTGQAVSCGTAREAVYTFTSEEGVSNWKIQGGLTNFTGADAVVTVEGAASYTVAQSIPGGSSNRIITVNGTSSECSAVTIRVTWTSTNSGGIITGAWSVVDAGGVDLAPEVPGLSCN